ncbi:response regulator [Telmatospirillum sp. J64-1]|uniref:hybrid sensor histidine kinase/response regulator n=1 Tax=Telmatospirillum sp. J64-1 TaxID=2502183 RepID=UPI00115EECD7|nr:response regulator [Telmatospirillum sp. J64-1]
MTENIRQILLDAFRSEYREYLDGIRARLAAPEAVGADAMQEMFRQAHSLKGAARAVDLGAVEAVAHGLETLFARVQEGELPLPGPVAVLSGRILDAIEDLASAPLEESDTPPPADLMAEIEAVLSGRPLSSAPPPPSSPPPTPPPPSSSPMPATETALAGESTAEQVRVGAGRLDSLLGAVTELLVEQRRQDRVSADLARLDEALGELENAWRRLRDGIPTGSELAQHMDRVEQRLRVTQRLGREVRRHQSAVSWSSQRLGRSLHEEVRRARMIPAENIFSGFRKMVRDLARDHGKQVEFRATGLEVEADRMVLQGLKAPVMHLLRNAISHGVETPEERRAKGKPETATIRLELSTVEGRLRVVVQDDGRGLDPEAILEAATARGLLTPAEAETISRDRVADLIFSPGLSTSQGVNNLSGRGIGLSVVREAVMRLHGSAEAREAPGGGTSFVLLVPLSATAQRLLLLRVQGRSWGLPASSAERLLRIPRSQLLHIEGALALPNPEGPIQLVALASLLGLSSNVEAEGAMMHLVVLRWGERRLAVAVDAFEGLRDAVVKDLGGLPLDSSPAGGGVILDDGSVALVLNPFRLMQLAGRTATALEVSERAPVKKVPTVLVVDDSLTTRTLEKSILEAHGYRVRLAVDGMEALASLRAEPVDLVVTDVQMPHLDGFGLLQAIKTDPALSSIPVILVTSLERREDQAKGLALGADAYVVKRKFDQKELLETIGQLI